jgi:hypothetical protein
LDVQRALIVALADEPRRSGKNALAAGRFGAFVERGSAF